MGNVCMSALIANEVAPTPRCISELLVKIIVEFFLTFSFVFLSTTGS